MVRGHACSKGRADQLWQVEAGIPWCQADLTVPALTIRVTLGRAVPLLEAVSLFVQQGKWETAMLVRIYIRQGAQYTSHCSINVGPLKQRLLASP